MSAPSVSTQVVIAGAGPVGLLLAIDLGRRGVRCVLLEREETTAPWPKMDRSNARTMELFRRMGLADDVRALGYPADVPMDVFLCTRLADDPLLVLRHPSVAAAREAGAACNDGSLPLEPYQLVSQNRLEPLLKEVAERTENVEVCFGWELERLAQDGDGVTATVRGGGGTREVRAAYLVGADGGRSTVRKQLGIALEGAAALADVVQVIFGSETLYDRIPMGRGRHYVFVDEAASTLVAQGDRKEFTLHTSLPADTDFEPVIRSLVGFDFDLEIRHVIPWRYHLLVAERYRSGRVFLAGDSAHLVIPTGGLGMNTGVGDALDLSWKLAGTVAGWGGPRLLDSYEAERRPVGLFNRDAAGWAAEGVLNWRRLVRLEALHDPEFLATASHEHNKMHLMRGAELGYTYPGSPVIAHEEGAPTTWEAVPYTPSAQPGARLPHLWLADGRPIQDLLGHDWTLLDLHASDRDGGSRTDGLLTSFGQAGIPCALVSLDEPVLAAAYGASLLLLRPDLHVAWRGDEAPVDPGRLVQLVSGHGDRVQARESASVGSMAVAR